MDGKLTVLEGALSLMPQAQTLLRAVWRAPDASNWMMGMGIATEGLQNLTVTGDEAIRKAVDLFDSMDQDSYFAVAQYKRTSDRTSKSAQHAFAFWADIDCGPDKGYSNIEEARIAVDKFCIQARLPEPTHIVISGGGIHSYWALSECVERAAWLQYASKLKSIMKSLGLRADPSRTADIASMLRVPGTLNRKYNPPKMVVLERSNDCPIQTKQMVEAIAQAHLTHCKASIQKTVEQEAHETLEFAAPQFQSLQSALRHLDPDCDEATWKIRRIAPLARAAKDHPAFADELRALAKHWSSGGLWNTASSAWTTPGSGSGKTGEEVFQEVWDRFRLEAAFDGRTSLGSVFHDARAAGWKQSVGEQPVHILELSKDEVKAEARLVAQAAIERFKSGDMGAPYEPESLTALCTLGRMHPAELQRIKAQLKEAKRSFSLGDLDKALKSHAKTEKASAPTHHAYASDILARLTVNGCVPVTYQGSLYVLKADTNLWVTLPASEVERHITRHHDGKENCMRRVDYKSICEQVFTTAEDPKFFDSAPAGIVCKGVFYTVEGDAIRHEALQPDHRQRVMLDFSIEEKPTPKFEKFLHETFRSDVDGEEMQQRRLMQEIAGATLMGLMPRYQKAVFWYDPYGRAGKGTMQSILEKLVPSEFVTAISPVMWGEQYYVATLAGKRLNVVGELPQDGFIPAAQFKGVIGGDLMTGRNPAGRPISFRNEASHVFMSNHMINTKDYTEAFFERWIMVSFPNSRLKLELPLDPMLARGIVEEEMGGIAYWALQGAMRLQAQGKFSSSTVHDRLMSNWRRSANALDEFIHDACQLDPKHLVRRRAFYEAFKVWCDENGRKPQSSKKAYEMLEHNVKLGIRQAKLDGYDVLRGVRLKGDANQEHAFSIEEVPNSTDASLNGNTEHPDF